MGTARSTTPVSGGVPSRRAYDVPEVAVLLAGVSERYVWSLIARKELGSIKIGARRVVPAEDLEAFIERLRADEAQARAGVVPAAA
jgi:excisionase family DNA binding protein